jgi:hypothetical protein
LGRRVFSGGWNIESGGNQLAGYVVVAGILAAGIWLSRSSIRRSHAWLRWTLASLLVACAAAASMAWPIESATWALLGFVSAGCLLLPAPFGMATLAGVLGLQLLLSWINSVKIGLTSLPLTVLDIKIALANPAGLWDALALPHWTRHVIGFVIAVALLSWLVAGLVAATRFAASYRKRTTSRVTS